MAAARVPARVGNLGEKDKLAEEGRRDRSSVHFIS
jgi:hypothetical protein